MGVGVPRGRVFWAAGNYVTSTIITNKINVDIIWLFICEIKTTMKE